MRLNFFSTTTRQTPPLNEWRVGSERDARVGGKVYKKLTQIPETFKKLHLGLDAFKILEDHAPWTCLLATGLMEARALLLFSFISKC